jgi:Ni/Co efflux regulator RcnB
MKRIISMIALAAITMGSVYAAPVQQQQTDTTKTKMKSKDGKMKMKKKMKDTTSKMKRDSVRP